MAYLAHAAQQLRDEITALDEKAEVTEYGEPDGVGIGRSVLVNGVDREGLEQMLDLGGDERIESVRREKGGLVVTFVGDPRADHRTPFDLAGMTSILKQV